MNEDEDDLIAQALKAINGDPFLNSPGDIDAIIAYQRRSRAQWESGVKPKKQEMSTGKPLDQIIPALAPAAQGSRFRRR